VKLRVSFDDKDVRRYLKRVQKKALPKATARALNDTAFAVKRKLEKVLPKYLDRPTPFTTRAFRVRKANRGKLESIVHLAPIQDAYLSYQIAGGTRRPRGKVLPVPFKRNVRLNKYGNLPGGRNKTAKLLARKRAFSGEVKGIAGIWQRKGKRVKLLAAYEKVAQYKPRLPFFAVAEREATRVWPRHFRRRLLKALAS